MRFLSYYILFLFHALIATAQNIPYSFPTDKSTLQLMINRWTVDEGLPSQGLRNFIQAQDGYFWITSYDGLIRFDGVNFTIFNSKNTAAFKENICSHVTEDKSNTLWFISRGKLLNYKKAIFNEFNLPEGFGKISGPLFVDTKNRLWLKSSTHGIFYIESGKAIFFDNPVVKGTSISSITEDQLANIYLGTKQNKIIKFNNNKFSVYINLGGHKKATIKFLHFFNKRLYWVNDQKELFYFNNGLVKKEILFRNERYFSIKLDRHGNRWVSTEKGVYEQEAKSGKIKQLMHNSNNFSLDVVDETLVDYEGNLWLRLNRKGLIKVRYGKFATINTLNGFGGKIANTIYQTKSGNVLVGFDNGVIDQVKNNKVSEFMSASETQSARIRHIMADSHNNYWISTYSGLLKRSPSGKIYWYNKSSGFPTNQTRIAFEDSHKNIWVGTKANGIIKLNDNKGFEFFPKKEAVEKVQVISIKENKDGNLMVSTAGDGLFVLSENRIIKQYNSSNELNTNVVFNSLDNIDGVIWLVTNGGGLIRLKDEKPTFYTMRNGLKNDSPFDIIEDNLGYFWMPYSNGVMRVDKKQLNEYAEGIIDRYTCETFDKSDGIKSSGFTPAGHALKTTDGRIWFPSLDGVEIIDPENISYNKLPPPVHIEEFSIDKVALDLADSIIIDASKQRFNFRYTAICMKAPEKIRFRYKLEGFDEQWIETDSKTRRVSYTNLKHGQYIFMVTACNNDGIWNTNNASISFVVEPHFYETTWFITICIFLTLAFLLLAYKIRINYIRKNERKLKEIVTERTAKILMQKSEIESQRDEIYTINENLLQQKSELETHKNNLEELVGKRTAELEHEKIKAEESDKLKTAFLNNMSHEIRTPMNGILGFTQLLALPDLTESRRDEYVEVVTKSTNQLLNIVDEIIYISKIEAGVEKLKKNSVNVNLLLADIYKSHLAAAKTKKIKIILEPGLDDKQSTINSDLAKLNQILNILIDNAFKFTKKGKIAFGYEKKQDFLVFYVKDSGIGIDQEMHHKVFHQFRQVEESNTRQYGGLGLGLSISKAYVELLGGKIWLDSTINEGTTFYFSIPYDVGQAKN